MKDTTTTSLPRMDLPPLRIEYEPTDVDSVRRPVLVRQIQIKRGDDELPFHSHRKGQLVLALSGSVMCKLPNGLLFGPANAGVWVPGGVEHCNTFSGKGDYFGVFIEPSMAPMPNKCCTMMLTPLIREMVRHLADLPLIYPENGPTSRLAQVLVDELIQMPRDSMYLPISQDRRFAKLAEAILGDPSNRLTSKEWSQALGMSDRTFARFVKKETGVTFGRWRQNIQIIVAVQKISSGEPVKAVAEYLGYESVSAFITMFKKAMGKAPKHYLKERLQR